MIHIDFEVRKNCWNLYDSYGQICVGCGCCAEDKKTRYENRIACIERWLKDDLIFDMWDDDPEIRKIQEKNVKSNIRRYRRMLRYYKERVKQYTMSNCPCESCPTRKTYARLFDIHFYGADCPYVCGKYERWRREKEQNNETD